MSQQEQASPKSETTARSNPVEQAENTWKEAQGFAKQKKWEAAIAAAEAAIKLIKDLDFERYAIWTKTTDEWRVKIGDKGAIERIWRKKLFGVLPVWLVVAATAGFALITLSYQPMSSWFARYRVKREMSQLIEAGARALDRGKLSEAGDKFQQALKKDPSDGRAKLGEEITGVYELSNGQYDSEDIDSRLIELKQQTKEAPALRGHVLTVEGNLLFHDRMLDQAAEKYRAAIDERGTIVEAYMGLAAVHVFQRQFERAKPLLDKALSLSPKNQDAVSSLAAVAVALGDFEQARARYQQVLENETDRMQERLELATVLRILGQFEQAAAEQERVATAFDKNIKLPKNDAPWALTVFRDPPEEPWIARTTEQKREYLRRNRAATECLLGRSEQTARQKDTPPATPLTKADRTSIETLIVLELKAVAEKHLQHASRVQNCIDRLMRRDAIVGE